MPEIFDASTVPDDFAPIGTYRVLIEHAEVKANRAGTGRYVQVNTTILDGTEKGRKIFSRFNFDNPNPVAKNIGTHQLKSLCYAVGMPKIDLDMIGHAVKNKVVQAIVGVEDGQNGTQNTIKKFVFAEAPTGASPAPRQGIPAYQDSDMPPF